MTQWKLNAKIGDEDAWIDLGPFRIVYQWLDAEDGRTPLAWWRRLYAFRRPFRY